MTRTTWSLRAMRNIFLSAVNTLFFICCVNSVETTSGHGNHVVGQRLTGHDLEQGSWYTLNNITSAILASYSRIKRGQLGLWDIVQLLAICSLLQAFRIKRQGSLQDSGRLRDRDCANQGGRESSEKDAVTDAKSTDPGLLKKHSSFNSYTTSIASYHSVRTFYRPHPQADKLPSDPPLPLIVFVHGLGGSLAQFHPLIKSLVNVSPCFGIDFPGCGLSEFSQTSWEAYTTDALAELLVEAIERHLDRKGGQGVVLIGHSMGCSISAMVGSETSSLRGRNRIDVVGLIAVCPQANPPSEQQASVFRKFLYVPNTIFDLWRKWDRRGGPQSASVARFVGTNADTETKRLQVQFNKQSSTAVWRRMAWGALPILSKDGIRSGGMPGIDIWAGLRVPLLLIAGESDKITTPEQIEKIAMAVGKDDRSSCISDADTLHAKTDPDAKPVETIEVVKPATQGKSDPSAMNTTVLDSTSTENICHKTGEGERTRKRQVLKTSIIPASHALLYDHATYRIVAGLIQTFLADHIDSRLSLGWQLQHLSVEGKWDVKNLVKWQAVRPVSEPIAGIFRAMKTLREVDESHCPSKFVEDWKGSIKAVIDISHESPVYDPKRLDDGGIEYHKFPTVSKIPPTPSEVQDFIQLVNTLRNQRYSTGSDNRLIGVHCHYGFNRTGFFICSYLVEEKGYSVQQAIDEFRKQRPPGIRHNHFIDTLFVRYCIGLKRAPIL